MEHLFYSLAKGSIFGFSAAAPVGPISILCIQRTLAFGKRHGFITGLGAATADALCGMLAGLGVSALMNVFLKYSGWFQTAGALFLCYMGCMIARARPAGVGGTDSGNSSRSGMYLSTFLLTMLNPMTWLSFLGGFAGWGSGAMKEGGYLAAVCFVAGVFAGSTIWWGILSTGVNKLRGRIGSTGFRWINRTAGLMLIVLGGIGLVGVLVG